MLAFMAGMWSSVVLIQRGEVPAIEDVETALDVVRVSCSQSLDARHGRYLLLTQNG